MSCFDDFKDRFVSWSWFKDNSRDDIKIFEDFWDSFKDSSSWEYWSGLRSRDWFEISDVAEVKDEILDFSVENRALLEEFVKRYQLKRSA